jgi:hypothetical protein
VNPFLLSSLELKMEQQQSRIGGGSGIRRDQIHPFLLSSWELKQQQVKREQQEQREREIEANPESLEVYMNPFFLSSAEPVAAAKSSSSGGVRMGGNGNGAMGSTIAAAADAALL